MNEKIGPYQVVDIPPARRAWLNTLDLPRPTLSMYSLLDRRGCSPSARVVPVAPPNNSMEPTRPARCLALARC